MVRHQRFVVVAEEREINRSHDDQDGVHGQEVYPLNLESASEQSTLFIGRPGSFASKLRSGGSLVLCSVAEQGTPGRARLQDCRLSCFSL